MRVIITFGQSHAHSVNDIVFNKDVVGVIEAESHSAAREIAFEYFNDKFCTTYLEKDFDAGDMLKFYPGGKIPVNLRRNPMSDMPKARFKGSHKPINPDRRYEVDVLSTNAASPRTVIPQEYWEDLEARVDLEYAANNLPDERPF